MTPEEFHQSQVAEHNRGRKITVVDVPHPKTAVVMPKELTAENGAKHLMSGEFKIDVEHTCTACSFDLSGAPEECEVCGGEIQYTQKLVIDWTTIKEIYAKAVKHLAV
jgi:hypothetical protein